MPPPIPGFEARLIVDRNPTLKAMEIYHCAIKTMAFLAVIPWSSRLPSSHMDGPNSEVELIIAPWPDTSSRLLLVQHGVVGLYQAGYALAKIPVPAKGLLPRLYSGLFLQNKQLGYLKFVPMSQLPESQVNSTSSLANTGNSTSALQFRFDDGPWSVKDKSGTIVDPLDSSYRYNYQLGNVRVNIQDSFSAFLEAMATAASHDFDEADAVINAVSVSGDVALNLHGSSYLHSLPFPWGAVPRVLSLLWTYVIEEGGHFVEMDFELVADGEIFGKGFMMNVNPARTHLTSS